MSTTGWRCRTVDRAGLHVEVCTGVSDERKRQFSVMEWREQSNISCDEAFVEAQRWIEGVTKKKFGSNNFRSALENGVLLCELINKIRPGIIKRINRLPTPIAGLDNLNVFLRACGKLGLKEAQLFHPGDLQDLSTRVTVKHQETDRRLKNVLISIYWLGRKAQCDNSYDGPYLNFKAFEGLLGTALYKALQESSTQKGSNVRDSGFGDSWYSEREELYQLRGGGGGGHRSDDSLDSLDSLGSRPHSISSDTTLKGSSEGCCSDTEADSIYSMAGNKDTLSYRRSVVITPKTAAQFNQFLPTKDKSTAYVPAPLRKKRAERNDDNRRSWANPIYTEDDGRLTRQQQMEESIDGSKSTSDIQTDTAILRQARYEELQKFREQIKESDDKWQDDLSKWKTRRKSVNSDIVKKKEEREKIEQITVSGNRRSKTFKEMQEERENKSRNSIGSRLGSLSYPDNDDVFDGPVIAPRTRTLPPRSYTIDTPYYSSEPSQPSLKEEEPFAAVPAPGRAAFPPTKQEINILDSPAGSDTTTAITPSLISYSRSSQRAADVPLEKSPVSEYSRTTKTEETTTIVSSSSSLQKVPEPRGPLLSSQTKVEAPSSGFLYKQQPQLSSMEPKPPGVSRVSASLPRSYQRLDSARLTSVVAPRPFGTSRISSLSRSSTTDDSHKRVNGDASVSKKSSVPSRYQQFMTSEDEAQSSSAHSSEDEEEEAAETQSLSPVPPPVKSDAPVSPARAKDNSQENYCEMRINLNQKPNSSRDFGFQAAWDSTGAHVTSIQSGSPAEMCRLQVGDEVLTVNRHKVAEMSYTDWKAYMEEAIQEGSLVMDIRRHGQNSSPDTNIINPSLDFTSRISTGTLQSKEGPANPVLIDLASNRVNGSFHEKSVTMRNKESEPISLKNLKRRSEFFETGGSEAVLPEIPVPPITPSSSSRWSWDPEEERRRQEKWQKEQERQLQEKYKRDQEKLQEEWQKAQEEIAKNKDQQELTKLGRLEGNSRSISPFSSLPQVNQATTTLWEEEERKRKEEHERQRQAEERERQRQAEERERQRQAEEQERQRQAEERRKREEEEAQELQRLQEERERKEKERKERQEEERKERQEEERKRREEELRWQRRREEEREEERRRQEAVEQQRRERERAFQQQQQKQQWAANVQPPLSYTDRIKSKSSPQLDEEERPQRRVTGSGLDERKGQQALSQSELERQQILNEMKKKTSLLTDSSWIRQQSSGFASNKESDVPPMRRGESLDNLDASYNSWRSSWTPRSNSYAPNYTRPHSALSGSTSFYSSGSATQRPSSTLPSSYSMGSLQSGAGTSSSLRSWRTPSPSFSSSTTSPEPTSEAGVPQQRSRSVSGKKVCTFCDTPLGKGAAMIIESLGLCYHLGCFKCIECKSNLGGSEAGAEVRIRNKQLYCNTCYMRFKSGQPTSM
ncbi:LIM domain only protein 7 isoform X6 [Solea senegalensis]|uniref:LIM domain only protein 7 isoform X6 n=3 Tax=Solea senegalensis TaxID=28829 RepID=A0AAV6R886_SOLSE|nr:LIM domain only protein 7 isoform X6 [Solea senegalensis]